MSAHRRPPPRPTPESGCSYAKKVRKVFSQTEDDQLSALVTQFGTQSWDIVAGHMRTRSARQCRDRWNTYVCPTVNREPWSSAEDRLLFTKYNEIGNKWSVLVGFFEHRSLNNVKNRWNSVVRKAQALGLDEQSERDFLYCADLITRAGAASKDGDDLPDDPAAQFQISNLLNPPA
jgi:hypothetical protein